jgi:zinc/manganese transport system permease protein
MIDALQLLWIPFVAAVLLTAIHTYLGIHVLARNVIFVDLALAQIAALGASVAFILGHPPQSLGAFAYSLAATLAGAVLLAFSRRVSTRIPQETLIGIVYVVSAAVALLVVDKSPQGAEQVKQMLVGSILTMTPADLLKLAAIYTGVAVLHWLLRRPFLAASFARDGAAHWTWDFLFYALFGVVVTSSVAVAGVLLVFSFLIIPAVIGVLFCSSVRGRWLLGWVAGSLASAAGLAASFAWDFPTGAAMVCAFALALVLAAIVRWLAVTKKIGKRLLDTARIGAAALLILSGAWLVLQPRADHPALDSIEAVWPGVRTIFLNADQARELAEAESASVRYEAEAARLNTLERASRWQGAPLSDEALRRLSSYVQSFNEMAKGERFVARTMRDSARVRQRWVLGVPALLIGIALLFSRHGPGVLDVALTRA